MISLDLAKRVVECTPGILDSLGISYKIYHNRIAMPCPVHGGDNSHGCSIFTTGLETVGNWKCWTHQCEKKYGKHIIGFYHGLIESMHKEKITDKQCIDWLIAKTKYTGDLSCNTELLTFAKFVQKKEAIEDQPRCSREMIRRYLKIPSKYYVERGYSAEILDRYDVGLCDIKGHEMNMRIVAPVYNDNLMVVGCTGRTTAPKCEQCKKFHFPTRHCPTNRLEEKWAAKWINSADFKAENFLYNMWYAKRHIKKCGIAILVEGQGDVWRLEEAGIKIGLGMFKACISDNQRSLLVNTGVRNVLLITDNDRAGIDGRKSVSESLARYVKIHNIETKDKDIGEMSIDAVRELLVPTLRGMST